MHTRQIASLSAAAAVVALHLIAPALALAQAGRVGDTQIAMAYPIGRWPDVKYDSNNQVYLATRGYAGSVLGAFLRPDGTPFTGAFVITQATNVTTSRVCFAAEANIFLVTWEQEPNNIKGRLLRFAGGGPLFLSDIFVINETGFKSTEAAPSCAYSPDTDRFLVTWAVFGASQDIGGQLVSLEGTLIGAPIPIATSPHGSRCRRWPTTRNSRSFSSSTRRRLRDRSRPAPASPRRAEMCWRSRPFTQTWG